MLLSRAKISTLAVFYPWWPLVWSGSWKQVIYWSFQHSFCVSNEIVSITINSYLWKFFLMVSVSNLVVFYPFLRRYPTVAMTQWVYILSQFKFSWAWPFLFQITISVLLRNDFCLEIYVHGRCFWATDLDFLEQGNFGSANAHLPQCLYQLTIL